MNPQLLDLLNRIGRIRVPPDDLSLSKDMRDAIIAAERDSVASAIRARRVLEGIIHRVFEQTTNELAGTRPLEGLLQRLVKDCQIPSELSGFACAVKELGNRVAHEPGKSIPVEYLVPTLNQLMFILEWYCACVGGLKYDARKDSDGLLMVGQQTTEFHTPLDVMNVPTPDSGGCHRHTPGGSRIGPTATFGNDAAFHVPSFHFGGVVPPHYFIDREAELAEAERIIVSGQSILLAGELRWGKTSFGKKLIHKLMDDSFEYQNRILCGYLNLQQCPELTPETFLEHTILNMLGEIARHVFGCKSWTLYEIDPAKSNSALKGDRLFDDFVNLHRLVELRSHSRGDSHPAPLRSEEFRHFVAELMNIVHEKGWSKFFIFYDEANHLPKKLSVELLTGNIEALDFTGVISMYAANPAVIETYGPLQDLFGHHITLKPFCEIRDLFRLLSRYYFNEPERVEDLPVEHRAVERIWALSKGIPYRIQLLAGHSFNMAFSMKANRVDAVHVIQAFEELKTKKPIEFSGV